MDTLSAGSDKHLKVYARIFIFVLGVGIFAGLLLASVSSSLAQKSERPGNLSGSENQGDAFQIKHSALLTDTVTATPTDTPTVTPVITSTLTATPTTTETPTPTGTATATGTSTITPTSTPTSTTTPTTTGTQLTPTVTGTLTVNPSLSVSVTPFSAKVNESFTFTILIGNTGTGPSHNNNLINSSFPSYMVVNTVTTSQGTITKLTRSFTVYIGEIDPGQVVTIIAIARVNSSPAQNETQTDTVTLTYDVGQSKTASRQYQVLSTTLPATGELPLNWRGERIKLGTMLPGLVILALGAVLLAMVIWSNGRNSNAKLWTAVGGALLILVGFILAASGFGLFNSIGFIQAPPQTPTSGVVIAPLEPMDTSIAGLPWRPASAYSTPDSVIPIVTLPDYPIPTPKITITPKPGDAEPDLSPVVRIVIPAMLLDTVVKYVPYDGFTWLISGLRQEIAWMGNTSWPGLGGNTGLAGHVTVAGMGDGPFRHLDELPVGELVLLYTEKNVYTYQVRESRVTDDADMSVVSSSEIPQISLITCVNWDDETRTYLNRLVVVAGLTRTDPVVINSSH